MSTVKTTPRVYGKRLRRLREERFYSRADLAERAGISTTTIQNLETGDHPGAHARTVRKLAEALGVPPNDIAEG
jgi:HTH-type transcriptional regulator, competence development regulator